MNIFKLTFKKSTRVSLVHILLTNMLTLETYAVIKERSNTKISGNLTQNTMKLHQFRAEAGRACKIPLLLPLQKPHFVLEIIDASE